MSNPSRRGLFGLFAGAALAPQMFAATPSLGWALRTYNIPANYIVTRADLEDDLYGRLVDDEFTTGDVLSVERRFSINEVDWRGLYGTPGR